MSELRKIFQPCEVPGRATAEQGVVILDGPDGVAVSMTPDCAVRTAESLQQAAAQASASNGAEPGDSGA